MAYSSPLNCVDFSANLLKIFSLLYLTLDANSFKRQMQVSKLLRCKTVYITHFLLQSHKENEQ